MRFAMCNKADIINPSDSFCILFFHKWLMTARMFFGSFVFPASFGIHVLHTGKALVILLRSHRLAARKLAQGASAVLPPGLWGLLLLLPLQLWNSNEEVASADFCY